MAKKMSPTMLWILALVIVLLAVVLSLYFTGKLVKFTLVSGSYTDKEGDKFLVKSMGMDKFQLTNPDDEKEMYMFKRQDMNKFMSDDIPIMITLLGSDHFEMMGGDKNLDLRLQK